MKRYGVMLKISLSAALRAPRTWILALTVFLVGLVGLWVPETEQAAPIQVGVAQEADDALWRLLEQKSGTVVEFLLSDPETIRGKVAAGQWDCGVLPEEDFSRRIARGDTEGLLTVVIGPGSVAYPIVQETLAAAVMELASPAIGAEYLADAGMLSPEAAVSAMEQQYRELTEDQRVLVTMQTLDGRPLDALTLAKRQTGRILRGILALVLLAAALYLSEDLGKWLSSGNGRRMLAIRPAWYLLAPRAAAGLLGPALGTLGALALLGAEALPAGAAYLLLLGTLAAALARGKQGILPVLMPFLLLAAALLSPIVFEVGTVWPGAGRISELLPVTLFLRASEGSLPALGGLLAETGLLAALTWAPGKSRN